MSNFGFENALEDLQVRDDFKRLSRILETGESQTVKCL
jgi:hypothetical protein